MIRSHRCGVSENNFDSPEPYGKLRFEDGKWNLFDVEGYYCLQDVKFCPYCGVKLE